MKRDELIDLERAGWEALSSSGEAARAFYERVLDRTVLMLLPGGMVLDERAAIIESMSIRLPMCGTRIGEDLTNAKQDADAPRDEALMKTTRAVVAPYALGPFL